MSGQVVGTILPRHDQDWFRIDPAQHGELTIAVADEPDGLETRLAVIPEGGNWLPDVAPDGFDGLAVDLASPMPHFLKVDSAASARSIDPYRLVTTFRPSPDVFEPNPNAQTAPRIPASGSIVGTILPRHDQDWFVFQAGEGSRITVTIEDAPAGLGLGLGIIPEGGNWLRDLSDDPGQLVVEAPASGTHFLKVDATAGTRSIDPYRLSVRVE